MIFPLAALSSALLAGPDLELRGVIADEQGVFCSLHDLRLGGYTLATPGLGADDWRLIEYQPDQNTAIVRRDGRLHKIPLSSSRISANETAYAAVNHHPPSPYAGSGELTPRSAQARSDPRHAPGLPLGGLRGDLSRENQTALVLRRSGRDAPATARNAADGAVAIANSSDPFSGMARRPMTDAAILRTLDVVN